MLEVSCWTITGERQAARIRALYLKAILRQDIAFFDMEMSTGQVVERMAGDTFLIQDAIGEKVRSFETVGSERLIAKLHFFFDVHILNSPTRGRSPSSLNKTKRIPVRCCGDSR